MDLKSHPFFKIIELAASDEKKLKKHKEYKGPTWGGGNAKKSQFFNALKQAVPFVFDKRTTHEKNANTKHLASFEDIVEDFSLPFSTSLYLMTEPVTMSSPMGHADAERALQTVFGYLIHELTPEKFHVFQVSTIELDGGTLPSIDQYELDLGLIETMNRQLSALRSISDELADAEDRKPTTYFFKNVATILGFTQAISVKRVGTEHVRPFSVKSRDIGTGFTVVKIDRLYYIADKVDYDYFSKVERPGVTWITSGMCRGHWRAFYARDSVGQKIKDQYGRNVVDYNRHGKNRAGDEKVVPGYSWVVEHVRGDPELAEIKTRMVVKK